MKTLLEYQTQLAVIESEIVRLEIFMTEQDLCIKTSRTHDALGGPAEELVALTERLLYAYDGCRTILLTNIEKAERAQRSLTDCIRLPGDR